MATENKKPHTVLGIVGDSATGKTTLTSGIAAILGPDRVTTICTDDYHAFDRKERAENGLSALDPRCNYIDILEQHVKLVSEGQPILRPVYNHTHGTLDRPVYVEPKEFIIFEGLLGFTTRQLRDLFDVKVYLEPDEDLRIRWKVARDTGKRGYTEEAVLKSLKKREADSPAYIWPQRTFADMVVSFVPPEDDATETGAHLNVRHTLRPTLPHPDLSSILESGIQNGLHLELMRDRDGKPVDVLQIPGNISDNAAKKLEDLVWSLLPEAQELRANVGKFMDAQNISHMSHPLALTQLLIAYHMVKASVGVHAI
ncbi:MAG: phosphoribulokinase [Proteobacteria bacterium]|nr:phosphoribulokinase [Pseudomonadota bacterium]MDA1131967.1 phosphoribulokinase [Pseudomonadota bacterium]